MIKQLYTYPDLLQDPHLAVSINPKLLQHELFPVPIRSGYPGPLARPGILTDPYPLTVFPVALELLPIVPTEPRIVHTSPAIPWA